MCARATSCRAPRVISPCRSTSGSRHGANAGSRRCTWQAARLICPTGGYRDNLSSSAWKNNPLAPFGKTEVGYPCSDSLRGAYASSRTSDRNAMGAGGQVGRTCLSRTAKACGPDLPTLRPSRADDVSATTGAKKPGPRGERAISRKAIAQGRPECPAEPVVPSPCFFVARGPWARRSPGLPCALDFEGSLDAAQPGRKAPRDGARAPRRRLTGTGQRLDPRRDGAISTFSGSKFGQTV
jgi:hypothetical protein